MGSSLMDSIQTNCESHVKELSVIWDYIGFEEPDRILRVNKISEEIKQMLLLTIEDENRFRLEIESEIESKKREIAQLCQTLKINTFFPPRDLSSFSLLKVLQEKFTELSEMRQERQNKYLQLYQGILRLQRLMTLQDNADLSAKVKANLLNDPEVSDQTSRVRDDFIPSETEIAELQQRCSELDSMYQELSEKYDNLLRDVGRIAADIEYLGETEFERGLLLHGDATDDGNIGQKDVGDAVLQQMQGLRLKLVKRKAMLVSTCEELRSYLLSMWYRLGFQEESRAAFMEAHVGYKPDVLEALQEEVAKCQQMKWEQISVYYSGLLDEKEDLERKLLLSSSEEARTNLTVEDVNGSSGSSGLEAALMTEEKISELEHDIERMKERYERHRSLYDTVATYQELWRAYVHVETQMRDPTILSNRGGILLKTEKEKKRLLKELPKTEAVVAQAIEEFERNSKTRFHVWNNLTFKDWVQHLWTEFRSRKETSRYKRPSSGTQSVSSSPRRLSSATRVK